MEYYNVKDPVFAVQGDNIFDIDLQHILSFHRGKKAFMTIGLMPVADVAGYGIADIASDMRISRFVEKPPPQKAPSKLANTGLYLLSPEIRAVFKERKIREMIKTHNRLDFGYDLIPYLVESGRPVYGYVLQGAWYDIGTPERYLEAMKGILHGQLKSLNDFGGKVSEYSSLWIQGESTESIQRRREIVRKVREGKIEFEGAVLIGRHCQIADGVKIVDSCIDNYSRIDRNVTIEGSAVMDRTIIGRNTEIRESIIGRHATIDSTAAKTTRLRNSVVGDDVTLGEGCQLITAKVYPHKHVPQESLIENYSIT